MLTVLIHGFWGGPADWNGVIRELPLGLEVWTPDLYEPGPLAPHHDFGAWTEHFLEEIEERARGGPVQVVGYSMGARLLTHALVRKPDVFTRALVLSAQVLPALADSKQDTSRRQTWESAWHQRFLTDPWQDLERDWNLQGVFAGSALPARRLDGRLREMLGQSLVHWSPTRHAFGADDVKSLPGAVNWAFGALDQKYVVVAKDLANLPVKGQISVIENAGHRLPWDAAGWVRQWIESGKL